MKKPQFALLFFLLSLAHYAAGQASVQDLEKYLDQLGSNPAAPIPPSVLTDFTNEKSLVQHLISHRKDPGEQFQLRVLDLMRLIGLKSKKPDTRKSVVSHMVITIPDNNLRIGGFAGAAVLQFGKQDFGAKEKDSVVSYLRRGIPNLDGLFRLAGFLEIPAAKEKISAMLITPMSTLLKWNARLALARMGDENAINFVIEKMTTTSVDDAFVHSLAPGLAYTRNKKVFAELERILQSDNYQCSSSNPASKGSISCAYRLLEVMTPAIENFPIEVDESGDLLVDNYQSALLTAREWLKQNPDYSLNRDTM